MLSEQKKIGLKLRKARPEKGLNQAELGKLVGKSSTFVSTLETGRSGFAVETLKRFATVLDKPLSYFYIWDDIEPGEPTMDREEKIKSTNVTVLKQLIEQLMKVLKESGVELPQKVSDKTNEEFMLELIKLLPPDMKKQITLELVKETFKNQD